MSGGTTEDRLRRLEIAAALLASGILAEDLP